MDHVVVIGGSLTGLFVAAALQHPQLELTIVERDILPAGPEPRPGVPQDEQPHVFLYRGLQAAEQLLPGLHHDLVAAGAVPFHTGNLPWLSPDGWLPLGRAGFEILSATRPLFESVVRRRVLALPGVRLRQGVRVSALERDGERWWVRLADQTSMSADLVVDASGRNTRLPVWLAELGLPKPRIEKIDAHVGYATRLYVETSSLGQCPGVVVAATPETLKGGLALRVEHGQWLVAAVGLGEHRPPRDDAEFEAFLADLVHPALVELTTHCVPAGSPATHRQTANVRHYYDKMPAWPTGLLAVGDAVCSFNPVYGQGVTVGCCQALMLRDADRRGCAPPDTPRLQRQLAAAVNTPWAIATSEDLRYPTSQGRQAWPQRLFGAWGGEVQRLAMDGDQRAERVVAELYHLVGSPAQLAHPALVLAAARRRIRTLTSAGP